MDFLVFIIAAVPKPKQSFYFPPKKWEFRKSQMVVGKRRMKNRSSHDSENVSWCLINPDCPTRTLKSKRVLACPIASKSAMGRERWLISPDCPRSACCWARWEFSGRCLINLISQQEYWRTREFLLAQFLPKKCLLLSERGSLGLSLFGNSNQDRSVFTFASTVLIHHNFRFDQLLSFLACQSTTTQQC